MEISVAGYKISLVTLLLIGLVMFILTGHTLCGCCEVQGFEGFTEGFVEGASKMTGVMADEPTAKKGAVKQNKM